MDPRLSSLLYSLFGARTSDLLNWLHGVEEDILKFLPQHSPLATLYDAAAEELSRRGHVDAALFEGLIGRFPKREADLRHLGTQLGLSIPRLVDHTADAVVVPNEPPEPPRIPQAARQQPVQDTAQPARGPAPRIQPIPTPVHTRAAPATDTFYRTLLICTVSAAISAAALAIFLNELQSLPKGFSNLPKNVMLALPCVPGLAYSLGLRMMLPTHASSSRALWLLWPLWLLVLILALLPLGIVVGGLLGVWGVRRLFARACGRPADWPTRAWLIVTTLVTVIPAQLAYFTDGHLFAPAAALSLVLWQSATGIVLWAGFLRSPPPR